MSFEPDDVVWLLTLDQIESHTGAILEKSRRAAGSVGNSTFAFDTGHVLYSKLRPYLNKVVCPDEVGIATTELIPLRPRSAILDRRYLAHYLRSPGFLAYSSQYVTGAKMPRVISDRFWEHQIPLPPLSEQRRIVEILDRADRLRRLRAEADTKADRILPALFIKLFGDPRNNVRKLPVVELGTVISDGPQNGLYKPASDYGDGTRILRIDGFYSGHVSNVEDLKRLRLSPDEIEKYGLRESDLVINRVNSEEYLGKSAIIPALDEPVVFESNMMRFSVDTSQVLPEFVIAHLQTPFTKLEILRRAKRAINQASVNQEDIRGLTLVRPPRREQERFAAMAAVAQDTVSQGREVREAVHSLFASLLHRAFSGELTASWREAHMTELVQEMEHQARALAVPARVE